MKDRVVLRNVHTTTGKTVDIVIGDRRIVEIVSPNTGIGDRIIDFYGQVYISSGWIDMHVHAFPEFEPYGDEIDEIGYKTGVTTIVDAGSTGADQIHELVRNSKNAKTNVLAFLNISKIGLKQIDELSNLSWLNEKKLIKAVTTHSDFVVGLKARISKSVVGLNGLEPLKLARKFSDVTDLPLMIHIGTGPPAISEILDLLKEKDVVTHYLHSKKNNLFDDSGKPLPTLLQAIKRGVHLDVGHGNASFSFSIAEQAKANGIKFDTISTDIYRENRLYGPVYDMAHVLTKFLYLDYSLEEVIDAVTVNAAKWLNKPELGRVAIGDIANLTLFSVENQSVMLKDSDGEERNYDKQINVKGVVVNGEYIDC
ncbi:amidohydrolase/deacetylase family metallohydrolase [Gracilibacillus kekensis]|uniref:Dihydroorotase n=1 Tax=Gracilibacillus kekensis TaxID=1027249 RepID=A0A1M7QTM4_9BACI|nr:amidohydrolase/deacetylase family metallohydrolase [Gracilibacillus kekensis]SHN34739.1 dihydroorotase [Gracilibacillus kekensis]